MHTLIPDAKRQSRLGRPRAYLVSACLLAALCAGAWLERARLLRDAADLWVVSDTITQADAAVVLGGGLDLRPFVAADLFKQGIVHEILISQAEDGRAVQIGAVSGHTEENVKVLRKLGIPDDVIKFFGSGNKNTWDEAVALKNWTKQHDVSAIIIPVDPFFSRRVSWIFHREFSGTTIHIEVVSFDPPGGYSKTEWWKTGEGVITFQNEVLKYLYYRLKH